MEEKEVKKRKKNCIEIEEKEKLSNLKENEDTVKNENVDRTTEILNMNVDEWEREKEEEKQQKANFHPIDGRRKHWLKRKKNGIDKLLFKRKTAEEKYYAR